MGAENLGLSEKDRIILVNEVNIVFHFAATLRLEANLPDAIIQNTLGTLRLMQLCKEFKQLKVNKDFAQCMVLIYIVFVYSLLYIYLRHSVTAMWKFWRKSCIQLPKILMRLSKCCRKTRMCYLMNKTSKYNWEPFYIQRIKLINVAMIISLKSSKQLNR